MLTHTEAAAAIKTFDTGVIEMLLDLAETDRRNLVNRYVGADRAEKIQRNNEVVAVLEGELAARRGLMSTEDILAALASSPDFVTVQDSDHLAYLLDVDEDEKAPAEENLTLTVKQATALEEPNDYRDYEVGQRIILIDLPYLGATVREVLPHCVGIDYDNDGADKGSHEAVYSRIRPMPHH